MHNKGLVLVLVFISIIMAWIGESDHQEAVTEYKRYCEMVQLWHENEDMPEFARPGWPPYKGECRGNK